MTQGARDPSANAWVVSIAARTAVGDHFARTRSKLKIWGSSSSARYALRVAAESAQTSPTAVRAPGKPSLG